MSYKIILALLTSLLFTSQSYSNDTRVCIQLAEVVNHFQDRYDQAVTSNENADAICTYSVSVETCKNDIRSELEESRASLEQATLSYVQAGCEL